MQLKVVGLISLATLLAAAPIPQTGSPPKDPWPYEYYTGFYPKGPGQPNLIQRREAAPAPIPVPAPAPIAKPAPQDGGAPSPWPYEYYYGRYPKGPPAIQRREASSVKYEQRDSTVPVPSATPDLEYAVGRVPEGVKVEGSFKVNGPKIGPFGPLKGPIPGPDPF